VTNNEPLYAAMLGVAALGFLTGFWLLPGGVLALRRRALGELQVDVRPGYSPKTLYRLLRLYGADGVRSFRRMLMADLIFPAVYGSLFWVLGDLALAAHPAAFWLASFAQVLGIIAAGLDYLENCFLLLALRSFPVERPFAARAAGISTSLKLLSIIAAAGALVAATLTHWTP